MNQVGPWSVKGIDQRARDAARDAAKEQGLTLGEYLNSLLLDEAEQPTDDVAQPYQRDMPRPQAATKSLDSLTRRIEAAEARSTLAITGIDQSVIGLLARLERSEDNSAAVAAHVDTVLEDIRSTHDTLQDKVRTLESDDTTQRNLEALKALEDALGKLASHVYEENALAQDETSAIKGRVENGFFELNDRLDGVETHVERTLTDAARRVEKAVQEAELRAEGTTRHLSDRFSSLERDVASKLEGVDPARLNAIDARVNNMSGDVTGALGSMENTLVRIQERLNRAETTTDAALQSLESTFAVLDQRINAVAAGADPEAAEELRRQFEIRFEGLADEVRRSVAATRAELAAEIERAAQVTNPEVLADVQSAISSVEQRLEMVEERDGASAIEAVRNEFGRLNEAVDARLGEIESRESQAIEKFGEDISLVADTLHQHVANSEKRSAEAIEQVGEDIGRVAETLQKQVADSEKRSAEAIEQVGAQVTYVGQRLETRQDEANRLLSEKLEQASQRQDSRLSEALSNVSQRLELMQTQTAATLSPVQKAIASLATRLESLEDFTAPPFASGTAKAAPIPAIPDLAISAPLIDPANAMLSPEKTAPASSSAAASDPFSELAKIAPPAKAVIADEFEAGIENWNSASPGAYDEDFDSPPPVATDPHEYVADLPSEEELSDDPLEFLGSWHADDASEARESDIFDTPGTMADDAEDNSRFDAAAETLTADASPASDNPETGDYLARARAAARAAAESRTALEASTKTKKKDKREKPVKPEKAAKPRAEKSESALGGRAPIYAGAAVVAIAAAGSTYYLNMRGKQVAAASIITAQPAATPEAEPVVGQIAEVTNEAAIDVAEAPDAPAAPDALDAAAETPLEGETAILASSTADPSLGIGEPVVTETVPDELADGEALEEGSAAPQAINAMTRAPIAPLATLEDAAASGKSAARYLLGIQELDAENFTAGAKLIMQAAEQGETVAEYRLAKLHEKGLGVPRDIAAARDWTRRAATGGNVKAMHDLAVFYAEGEGGSQTYAGSVEWFRKASEYGVVDSQYNLGVLYEEGLGISPNLTEALTWYEIARLQGDPGAQAKITDLRSRVSAEAAAQALRRAQEWSPRPIDPRANGEFAAADWAIGPNHVASVQRALAGLGYQAGGADGALGPTTIDAIRSYQIERGLPVTGTIDQALVDSLNAVS